MLRRHRQARAMRVEHENFRDAILGKQADIVTMEQGLRTVVVAEAAIESARTGATVSCLGDHRCGFDIGRLIEAPRGGPPIVRTMIAGLGTSAEESTTARKVHCEDRRRRPWQDRPSLAVQFASAGHQVVGVDVNQETVDLVNSGQEPFPGEAELAERLSRLVPSGRCEPPPTTPTRWPALRPSSSSSRSSSTTAPGSPTSAGWTPPPGRSRRTSAPARWSPTRRPYRWARPASAGSRCSRRVRAARGTDFHLVFSPERVLTGRVFADLRKYPKLFGALSPQGAERAGSSTRPSYSSTSAPISPDPTGSGTSAPGGRRAGQGSRRRRTGMSTSGWRTSSPASCRRRSRHLPGHRGQQLPAVQPHPPAWHRGGRSLHPGVPASLPLEGPEATVVRAAREANAEMPAYTVGLAEHPARTSLAGARVAVLGRHTVEASGRPPSQESSRPWLRFEPRMPFRSSTTRSSPMASSGTGPESIPSR